MPFDGLLTLTHSSRRTEPGRCSVQFLTSRFQDPERGDDLPPFESLPPPEPLYCGSVSFYRVMGDAAAVRVRLLGAIRDREKIQHVSLLGMDQLLVGYEHRLERWRLPGPAPELRRIHRSDCHVVATYEHPLLAGVHTVEPTDGGRRAVVSCSASDCVLVIDLEADGGAGEDQVQVLPMPDEIYPRFYPLPTGSGTMDLRRHYIDDEAQSTHLNAAWPLDPKRRDSRIAISTLIQGALGIFSRDGTYREVARGFVGCHGARTDDRDRLYFTDSTCGHLVWLTGDGTIDRRYAVDSRWLHDSVQLAGSVYAFALADRNELRLIDIDADRVLSRRRFLRWPVDGLFSLARNWPGWLGNSTQALGWTPFGGRFWATDDP